MIFNVVRLFRGLSDNITVALDLFPEVNILIFVIITSKLYIFDTSLLEVESFWYFISWAPILLICYVSNIIIKNTFGQSIQNKESL